MRSPSPFALTPWIKGLIAANVVIYFLTITVFTGPWFIDFFGFQPRRVVSHWWTPVTYMFLHGSFLHLAFNMLMLFFFGPAVEAKMGGRRFAGYYLVCGLGGAILSLGLMLTTPVAGVVGASGAVFGVALAFAMYWPDEGIYVFPLPMPVKAKWLVIFLATVSLVAAITGARDGVAHLAHLGGFVFGFVFLKAQVLVEQRVQEVRQRPRLAQVVPPRQPRQRQIAETPGLPETTEPSTDEELNRVLDKISRSGVDSLTASERRVLEDASRQLRDN